MSGINLSAKEMEELSLIMDEMEEFPARGRRGLYILQNESDPPAPERIRLPNLEQYFPLWEIRNNRLEGLDKEGFFMQVTGSYYPDFILEKGLTFVSTPLLEYLKTKIDTEAMEYNWIGMATEGGRRNEEYRVLIPDQLDIIRPESIRRDRNSIIQYLEMDDTKISEAGLFRVAGFPYLMITEKLNRIRYSGFRCVRLENFFDYQGVRDREYRERVDGNRLAAVAEDYGEKGNATGNSNYKYGLIRVFEEVRPEEMEAGLKSVFDSYWGDGFPGERLSARFLDFTWSPERLTINLTGASADQFKTTGFTMTSLEETRDFVSKLPDELRTAAEKVVRERVLSLAIAGCRRLFDGYEAIHGGQRFRIHLLDETLPTANPPMIYDYKNKFQNQVEQAADLKTLDLSGQDLREFDLGGKDLSGVRINGSNLGRANLHGANLTGAEFTGCNLTGTDLTDSTLNQVRLTDCQLNRTLFDRAVLKEAVISGSDLFQVRFIKSDLTGARIKTQSLNFVYFYKARLNEVYFEIPANINHNVFKICDLRNAKFIGNSNKAESIMSNCDFGNSDLSNCQFELNVVTENLFIKSKLTNVDFSKCDCVLRCNFRWSSCLALNLAGVKVTANDFTFVDLSKMKTKKYIVFLNNDFSYAILTGFDFSTTEYLLPNKLIYTDLSNCNFPDADFRSSVVIEPDLKGARLKGALFNQKQLEFIKLTAMQQREIQVPVEADEAERGEANG